MSTADPSAGELADDALDVQDGQWIDACEGLVEQHEARLRCERSSDLHAATLAA